MADRRWCFLKPLWEQFMRGPPGKLTRDEVRDEVHRHRNLTMMEQAEQQRDRQQISEIQRMTRRTMARFELARKQREKELRHGHK